MAASFIYIYWAVRVVTIAHRNLLRQPGTTGMTSNVVHSHMIASMPYRIVQVRPLVNQLKSL
eukprot:6204030-Pleurochrysis_carterae.AAC.1